MKRVFFAFCLILIALQGCNKTDTGTSSQVTISGMTPTQVYRGQTVDGQIHGSNFNGVVVVNLGPGLRVLQITQATSTNVSLRFFVESNAEPGPRTVSIQTSAGTAQNSNALSVGSNRVPDVRFTVSPDVGVTNVPFNFDASASNDVDGNITSYNWNFGDGATASGRIVSHRFGSPNTFTVTLTLTDNDQGQSSATKNIEVKKGVLPIPLFDVSPNTGTADTNFRFDASRSRDPDGRVVQYRWDLGDGKKANGRVVHHKFRNSAEYPVELTVTDDDGLESSVGKEVRVQGSAPIARITISPSIGNTSTSYTFSASGSEDSDGFIQSYSWSFGDGASAAGPTVAHRFARPETYTIRLAVTDNSGLTGQATTSLRVFTDDGSGGGSGGGGTGGGGGGGSAEGRCTTPSKLRKYFLFKVLSEDRASKTLVGQFYEDVSCNQVFYLCGDVRVGGIQPGSKEQWIGTICRMDSLGNNTFKIYLVNGKSWVNAGETGTYVWPQLDCNPHIYCTAFGY